MFVSIIAVSFTSWCVSSSLFVVLGDFVFLTQESLIGWLDRTKNRILNFSILGWEYAAPNAIVYIVYELCATMAHVNVAAHKNCISQLQEAAII